MGIYFDRVPEPFGGAVFRPANVDFILIPTNDLDLAIEGLGDKLAVRLQIVAEVEVFLVLVRRAVVEVDSDTAGQKQRGGEERGGK